MLGSSFQDIRDQTVSRARTVDRIDKGNQWDSHMICSTGGVAHLFSQLLYAHHVPVRAREVRRKRKRSPKNDSSADADQSAMP